MTSSELSAADIAAVTGNRSNDGFGDNGSWWAILFLFAMFGGWGGNRGFGGNGGGGYDLYPWLNNSNQVNDGFRDQMINNNITSVRDAIYGITPQLCNGFASVANGFAQAEIAANARQMADMQQNFSLQTSMMQGFNNSQAQQADLKYTVATEACADRNAISQGIRDVMENCNRNNQAILDKLCQLELDGLKQDNANLRTQLNMANLAASQTAQTAELRQSQANTANQLISELRSCPIPAQPVYGSQPIFTCGGNQGCGCGMSM